ncbi:MAG: hypothetical protein HY926_14880 [Elusimicrobia bacterium]|nr:hypothetical protein [Elusimicrobiota bacterium]
MDADKDRGFYRGGRAGSWLGLAASFTGTAWAFFHSGAAGGWTGDRWLALCIAGPVLVAGGWIAGKFAGSYVGELLYSGRREQAGSLAGAAAGALLAELCWDRNGMWLIGLAIGAGIGRYLAQPRT